MAISPSNSGTLRNVGDVVALERDPTHDCVGVQVYGDGDGVELIFEGSVMGAGLCQLECPSAEPMPIVADGRFACLVPAAGISHFQARLAAINSGCANVAIYSGMADKMKLVAAPAAGGEKKTVMPTKLARGKTPPATGFRVHESDGKFYVIDNVTGRSSEPFRNRQEAEKWLVAQPVQAAAPGGWAGSFTVKQNGAQFFVIDAAGHASDPFKTKAEADQWIAANPKPAPVAAK